MESCSSVMRFMKRWNGAGGRRDLEAQEPRWAQGGSSSGDSCPVESLRCGRHLAVGGLETGVRPARADNGTTGEVQR